MENSYRLLKQLQIELPAIPLPDILGIIYKRIEGRVLKNYVHTPISVALFKAGLFPKVKSWN